MSLGTTRGAASAVIGSERTAFDLLPYVSLLDAFMFAGPPGIMATFTNWGTIGSFGDGVSRQLAAADERIAPKSSRNGWYYFGFAAATLAMVVLTDGEALLGPASGVARGLVASDLGLLSNTSLRALQGTITDAGTTRIIQVEYIESAGDLLPQLRSALPKILSTARADGVTTLQIEASFANPGFQRFVPAAVDKLGGIYSSVGGRDFITFILSGGK